MIDTHCHLTRPELSADLESILACCQAAGVHHCISVATSTADSLAARVLAERHTCVLFSAGVHPLHSDEPIDWEQMRHASQSPRCVAWGELGLDYHYPQPPREVQHRVLDEQLDHIRRWQAEELGRPIIIHCRKAFEELIPILKNTGLPPDMFVFHCFNAGPSEARLILDFGAWLSFTGILTYKNAPQVREAAKLAPLDRIMVETDAPFLSPEPHRGEWPNRPHQVTLVARCLAAERGMNETDLETMLDQNAVRFFGTLMRSEEPPSPFGSTAPDSAARITPHK